MGVLEAGGEIKRRQQAEGEAIKLEYNGVGRTGTTIALAHLLIQLQAQQNAGVANPRFSIFSTVRRLRQCRVALV